MFVVHMLHFIGLICSCSVTDFVFFRIMDALYERKFPDRRITYVLIFLVCIPIHVMIAWLCIPILNLGYSMVILCGLSFALYKPCGKNILVNSAIVIIYLAMIDISVTAVFSFLVDTSTFTALMQPKFYLLSSVGNAIVVICTNSLLIQVLQHYQISRISKALHAYMIFLMVFEFGIFLMFLKNEPYAGSNWELLLLCIGFLVLDAGILYLYRKISEQAKYEKKSLLIEQQQEMTAKYYEDLQENYEKTQKILHDMKKHLQTINELKQLDEETQKEYREEFLKSIEDIRLQFVCSDRILCAIIWNKIQMCERNGIDFDVSMQDILFDFMNKTEVTALFANLIDNGIEACLASDREKKAIFLRIHSFKEYVVIKMKNTIGTPPQMKNNRFISTKLGHLGLGMSIMEEIAEKYCGNINCDYSEEYFETKIILLDGNKE